MTFPEYNCLKPLYENGTIVGVVGVAMNNDTPTSICPQCQAEEPDYDGFGILAHTKPAYPNGCGYCSHPSSIDGVCSCCGKEDTQ